MKALESLSLSRLTLLEFGQHSKSIYRDVTELGNGKDFIKDVIYKNYLSGLNDASVGYDKAMVQISKSAETEKIVNADTVRDLSFAALSRYLSVFEVSNVPDEVQAYKNLIIIFKNYKGLKKWNLEEETNGIDTLVAELSNDKNAPSVTLINMSSYINRLANDNEAFKKIFSSRTHEVASKDIFDVRVLRKNLKTAYTDMAEYVLTMAKAQDTEEFNQSLKVINTVRKYYADLLAKRKPAKKGETLEPIPPMG
jgi:Family of unknown function (DUF6261)